MPRHAKTATQSVFSTAYRLRKKEKDPVIDAVHTVVDRAGMKLSAISQKGGPAFGTMKNWFDGDTLKPQFATLSATLRVIGYEFSIVPSRIKINGHGAKATAPKIEFRESNNGHAGRSLNASRRRLSRSVVGLPAAT